MPFLVGYTTRHATNAICMAIEAVLVITPMHHDVGIDILIIAKIIVLSMIAAARSI